MTGFRTCVGTSVLLDLLSHLLFFAEDPTSNLWKKNIKCLFKEHKQGETLLSSGSCSSNAWEVHIGRGVKGLSSLKYTVHVYLSDCIRVNLTRAKFQNVCGSLVENSYYIIIHYYVIATKHFTICLERYPSWESGVSIYTWSLYKLQKLVVKTETTLHIIHDNTWDGKTDRRSGQMLLPTELPRQPSWQCPNQCITALLNYVCNAH